jgi:hypothetical protein
MTMATAPFVVLTLPAQDTVLGECSALTGADFEGVARRARRDERFVLEVSIQSTTLPIDDAQRLNLRLGLTVEEMASTFDADADMWTTRFVLDLQHLNATTLRTVAQMGRGHAWFHLVGGMLSMRIMPHSTPVPTACDRIRHALQGIGLSWDVEQEEHDTEAMQPHVELLNAAYPESETVVPVRETPVRLGRLAALTNA